MNKFIRVTPSGEVETLRTEQNLNAELLSLFLPNLVPHDLTPNLTMWVNDESEELNTTAGVVYVQLTEIEADFYGDAIFTGRAYSDAVEGLTEDSEQFILSYLN